MMVRTNATPKQLDWEKVAELWDNTNFEALQRGASLSDASKEAALKTANALNIKLYEGQGGQLTLGERREPGMNMETLPDTGLIQRVLDLQQGASAAGWRQRGDGLLDNGPGAGVAGQVI